MDNNPKSAVEIGYRVKALIGYLRQLTFKKHNSWDPEVLELKRMINKNKKRKQDSSNTESE